MPNAIGMVEFNSIAKAITAVDQMIKAAPVDVLKSTPTCPGRYIVIVTGDVSAVDTAVQTARNIAQKRAIDYFVIANVHEAVFKAISAGKVKEHREALGIIETSTMASMVYAADAALKAADIMAHKLRLGTGIGGKAYFTFSGDVAAVEAAVRAGREILKDDKRIIATEVIPAPSRELWGTL